jgi:hypothetical protein
MPASHIVPWADCTDEQRLGGLEVDGRPRGLSRLNFVLVLVPGGCFALKIGRRGRRFFSDTGDQREKKHDEARCDTLLPRRRVA